MIATRRAQTGRGFTIIEMMTSVFILGLILLLIGYEFDHTISHLLHTQSNVDAESNARVTMAKIVDGLKAATPDVNAVIKVEQNEVIFRPLGAVATTSLVYRRVQQGSLTDPSKVVTTGGAPTPPFDQVTVQCKTACSPTTPDELVETTVDDVSGLTTGTRTIGHDVTGFSVSNNGNQTGGMIMITLSVAHPYDAKTAQYRTARCDPTCIYTMQSSVEVGGLSRND